MPEQSLHYPQLITGRERQGRWPGSSRRRSAARCPQWTFRGNSGASEYSRRRACPAHTEQRIATMAKLHRENRYDRFTDHVERVTGTPARTVAEFVTDRKNLYLSPCATAEAR